MIDQNELKKSAIKTFFSLIPYSVLGTALNEVIEYRSKIKQNRLNQFTELLENYFSNYQGINLENFQTEEFSDLFESVVKRVVQNKSADKLNLYKNVLINQLNNNEFNVDHSEIFLDLISSLQVIEIQILREHRKFKRCINIESSKLNDLESLMIDKLKVLEGTFKPEKTPHERGEMIREFDMYIAKKEAQKVLVEDLRRIKTPEYYSISESDFLFYKQRLFSKGLLVDEGIGAINNPPFMNMGITEFGNQFVDFIVNS